MLKNIAIGLIHFYQKHLSKHKGYHCAYGICTGRATCSGVGIRVFKKSGVIKGWALLRRQLDRCVICAAKLSQQKSESNLSASKEHETVTHLSVVGAPISRPMIRSQNGFVDCEGCDAPDCDIPDCDLPDIPSCEWPGLPSCEMSRVPGCNTLPSGIGCNYTSCLSVADGGVSFCNGCDFLNTSGRSSQEKAEQRQRDSQEARASRRSKIEPQT